MKVTYREWKEFWAALDAVPGHKDNWYEDEVESFGSNAKDEDTTDVRYGTLVWQGSGPQIDHPLIKGGGDWLKSFRAWKKGLNYKTFLVVVPNDDEEAFREVAKTRKWKVSGG